jgi:hypothetical protein
MLYIRCTSYETLTTKKETHHEREIKKKSIAEGFQIREAARQTERCHLFEFTRPRNGHWVLSGRIPESSIERIIFQKSINKGHGRRLLPVPPMENIMLKFTAEMYRGRQIGNQYNYRCGVQIIATDAETGKRKYAFNNSPCLKLWESVAHYQSGLNRYDAAECAEALKYAEKLAAKWNKTGKVGKY